MVSVDPLGGAARILFLVSSATVALISVSYLKRERLRHGEYFPLLLLATVGMSLMAVSADLIMTFLGLEILSISSYVLAGYRRGDPRSNESALKYFLLGAFSTAFMLYGIALLYGAAGSTKYSAIAEAAARGQAETATFLLGLGLLLVGFGFKAALAPLHVWTPDVYQGAPVPITAHLAVGSKAAVLITLLRLLHQVFPASADQWQTLLWIASAATMIIGNVAALTQTDVKRLLAYSSIAHAGYILLGVIANSPRGAQGVVFYLAAYSLMTLGAFAVVQVFGRREERFTRIDDYRGIGYRHPLLSVSLSIFLLSLIGIPPMAGFYGKLFLFSAAVEADLVVLVILAVLTSAVALYYYLQIIVLMFMKAAIRPPEAVPVPLAARVVILLMAAGTLYLGGLSGAGSIDCRGGGRVVKQAKAKLEGEIRKLERELREELPAALKKALQLGDLRENAEYQTAKERQSYVQARLGHLKQRLAKLSLINLSKIPRDRISYGSTVVLFDLDTEDEVTYRLVTSEESDVKAGKISTTSPIGRSLMNREEGDEVQIRTPGGTKHYEIVKLTTIHDEDQ